MDKLETQLFRAVAQSRRQSKVLREQGRHSSYEPLIEVSQGRLFQNMLDYTFAKLGNEASLRSLPKSKASKKNESSSKGSAGTGAYTMLQENTATGLDFFPPLRNRRATNASERLVDPKESSML